MTQYHVVTEGKTDDDEIPEKVKTICRPDDLWQLGQHRLLCGDAVKVEDLQKLMGGHKIDMVFTDPPYGVDYNSTSTGRSKKQWAKLANDKRATVGFFSSWLALLLQESLPNASYYICIGDTTAHILIQAFKELKIHWSVPVIWIKNHAPPSWNRYHHKHEPIYYCGPGSVPTGELCRWYGPNNEVTTWEISKDAHRDYQHPTQKPVALAARAVHNSSALNQIVVDLFGGSGSTMIACEKLGRRCFIIGAPVLHDGNCPALL